MRTEKRGRLESFACDDSSEDSTIQGDPAMRCSTFLQEELSVGTLPSLWVAHPMLGYVKEQLYPGTQKGLTFPHFRFAIPQRKAF